MKHVKISFAIIALLLAALYSCNKGKNTKTKTAFTISDSGAHVIGYTIYFKIVPTSGSSYHWDFGDLTTSNSATPTHVYTNPGTYTVKVTLNGNNTDTASKTFIINTDPILTHLIGGTRLWHHNYSVSGSVHDTFYAMPDTTFAINYIDPATLSIGPDTLAYFASSFSSGDTTLTFVHSVVSGGVQVSADALVFNKIDTSIILTRHNYASPSTVQTNVFFNF